jgi:hypothetical protein
MLFTVFAACVGREKLTRIEPVNRLGARERGRGRCVELRIARAAKRPERGAFGHLRKTENLFDAAVAVRRDDEDRTRKIFRVDLEDDVVMELALRPMADEIERAVTRSELVEDGAEDQCAREGIDDGMRKR